MPNLSTTVTFVAPAANNLRVMDNPADPPPFTTMDTSSRDFLRSFKLLKMAANTTIAVPC